MTAKKVIDEDGKWITNKGAFNFTDPGTGNRYEPGLPTKAKVTDWILTQSVLEFEGKDKAYAERFKPKVEEKK